MHRLIRSFVVLHGFMMVFRQNVVLKSNKTYAVAQHLKDCKKKLPVRKCNGFSLKDA